MYLEVGEKHPPRPREAGSRSRGIIPSHGTFPSVCPAKRVACASHQQGSLWRHAFTNDEGHHPARSRWVPRPRSRFAHLMSNIAHYGDDVYELLAASFDDPSATIVYPYVYRILNSATRAAAEEVNSEPRPNGTRRLPAASRDSPVVTRPQSPQSSVTSGDQRRSSLSRPRTASVSSANDDGYGPTSEEPDPDAQLVTIINHISSETTGAMHKEGITELHQFLKAYPHKKPRVEKLLESTGTAFRKYITRALASRAAEDSDRDAAVAHTLSSQFPWVPINGNSDRA